MKHLKLYSLASLLFFMLGCKNDDNGSHQNVSKTKEIQALIDNFTNDFQSKMPETTIGIGLYVLGDDGAFYISSEFPEEYAENIHFRVASNSKTFTAAAILKLHQENKLNIDDFITNLIPGTDRPYVPNTENYNVPYKEQITIRDLLLHRTGVFDVSNNPVPESVNAPYAGEYYIDYIKTLYGEDHTFSFEELISVVAQHQISDFTPGEQFHYSNTGYNILGVIIEKVSGKRMHEYLEEEFFMPLQLENTYSPHLGTDQQLPSPYVTSYVKIDGEVTEIDKDNLSSAISEGQIISTPKSLAKWGKALYGTDLVLNPDVLAMMIHGQPADASHGFYGLGTQVFPTDLGYGHDGARLAYLSTMRYHPESKRTYVIFTNHLNVDDFSGEANSLYDAIRGVIEILDQ